MFLRQLADKHPNAFRYGSAVLISLAALAIVLILPYHRQQPVLLFFEAGVALATWIGGWSAGGVALIGGTIASAYFALQHFGVPTVFRMVLNLVYTVGIIWVVAKLRFSQEALRQSEEALRRLNAELEQRVAERTAQLQTANQELLKEIADRKQAQEERDRLRHLEADLAHMNRVSMLGELAASLSHELRQPIAAAITNANACMRWLAQDEPDVQEAREAATRIVQNGNRAAEVITGLRSFYTKSAPAERELVDLNEVLREMLALLRSEADRYSISMRTEVAAELPKVGADRVQLQQVLLNLMLNGIEAMKETGGELTIKSELGQAGDPLLSVSDTGVGLPAEKADQIFNAFFTTKPQGSGMGLAISRSIMESHGGRLWATANPGRGATFHFTLPRLP